MLQYQGCGHLPHSLPGPPTPQKPPGPQWPQWFSWGLPAGARGHAVAPSFKRHARDAGVGRSPAIQLHAPVLRQGNPLTSPRAPSLPPRRLSPRLFCLSLAVSGRPSVLFCIPPGPITPCGVPIPRCGDPARASCPTERDSRSPGSPAVQGLRTQVHGEARSRVLLFWAQPGQEETKGGSPPFPGVPRVFPTISWCPDVSLSSQKHLSNSLFACKAPVQQLLGE